MIRSSKHVTCFVNKGKLENLNAFLAEMKQAVEFYVDCLWNNLKDYEISKFVSVKSLIPENTKLSKRALKCASDNATAVLRSIMEKPRKVLYIINKFKKEGKDYSSLQKWLDKYKLSKPRVNDKFELNSICCDIKKENNFWFLQLSHIGKTYGKIRIPIKQHRQGLKWNKEGKLLNSILISKDKMELRYEIEELYKTEGKSVGADQGELTCLTLSDGQITKENKDGYNLTKILDILARRKKGSKRFRKAQDHRKNYINWSINQLNFKDIKQINLEKIKNIRKGKIYSRKSSHWTYALIKDKLVRFGQEHKVYVKEQNCVYRSQRCSQCGLVHKGDRKGKMFSCSNCDLVMDADYNASINHEKSLPPVHHLRHLNLNKAGFYWKENGLFDLNGKEFPVPYTEKLKG